ncbi:MAG: UDP-glucose/GDP-mannose dehydrogenase family protein [Xanthomonadaceae bacterium]|nr:UDP-glucose/GDP-mannose dehydrogenase family protein [Xanthomonadaceae bacterium]
MKVTIIGTGYVGLVVGACFSDTGNQVSCVDKDPKKIAGLKDGIIPIYEPGLEDLVKRNVAEGRLHFTTSTSEGVKGADVVFMAVGTPPLPDGRSDLSYLKAASEEVGRALTGPCIIVNKSTVPIGSYLTVSEWVKQYSKQEVEVVSNPEFLKEGSALEDFLKPDRVVIGTNKEWAYQKMCELYAPFVRQGNPVILMDPVSAELTKYACNSFLATRISFMNELAQLADRLGADIEKVRQGMATDVRIGKHFLYSGVGYGGSCFPKDVQALVATSKDVGVPLQIVDAAERVNYGQKKYILKKIKAKFPGGLKGKVFAVWGLAFKPNTDDMREAPALIITDELIKEGARVRAFDPVAMEAAKPLLNPKVELCDSAYQAAEDADALVLVTEWNEFRHLDFEKLSTVMNSKIIFDGRNIYDPKTIKSKGFEYTGIGRS